MTLNVNTNIAAADDVYQLFIDAHEGLSEADSHRLNARLILILANHIGDANVLKEAVALARQTAAQQKA